MKQLSAFFLLVFVSFTFFSCGDPEEVMDTLSDSDLRDMIEADLASIESISEISVELAALPSEACNTLNDSSLSYTSPNGNLQLSSTWSWKITCAGLLPQTFEASASGNSSYNSAKVTSTSTLSVDCTVDNIVSNDDYLFDGSINFDQDASIIGRRANRALASQTNYDCNQLTIDRDTYEILSGTMSIDLAGSFNSGGTFSRGASLAFQGGGVATLTLDNGAVFTITF